MIGSRRRIGEFWEETGLIRSWRVMCRILARLIGPWRRESLQPEPGDGVDQSCSPTRKALGPGVPVREVAAWQEGSVGAVCPGRAPLQPQTDAV